METRKLRLYWRFCCNFLLHIGDLTTFKGSFVGASLAELPIPQVPIILVGNKADLESDRKVSKEKGEKQAEEWNCPWLESSAKTGQNIDKIFKDITRLILIKSGSALGKDGIDKKKKNKKNACMIL
jgi:GTPase SAR1 family protein